MKPLSDTHPMAFEPGSTAIEQSSRVGLPIASMDCHEVSSYAEVLEKVAALNYYNSRFKLLFRGQTSDYRLNHKGEPSQRSNLYPSILRAKSGVSREYLLDVRFKRLKEAEDLLISHFKVRDIHLRVVRWAILQHYEVCETPLLDVTPSLQTALSFACNSGQKPDGFLYVLAIPHTNGPVSISIESMTQTIDLCQICPPDALRPHFQSGVLLGDYPEYSDRYETHNQLGFVANDFSCRLLTKFHLLNMPQWGKEGFTPTPSEVLFPNGRDHWHQQLQSIKAQVVAFFE